MRPTAEHAPSQETSGAVRLANLTSFRVGGVATVFHQPVRTDDLRSLLLELRGSLPFLLGGGCNTLFPDGEFCRPVVSTAKLRGLELGDGWIRADAGVRLDALIRVANAAGLGGLEGFVGIPGSVGGAVVMNAGGAGWSFGERVETLGLVTIDGSESIQLSGKDVPWTYRRWNLDGYVVAWAKLRLRRDSPEELRRRALSFLRKKARTQPLGKPSAGCIFKNPNGLSAGALIEEAGLKGLAYGGARVSSRHANFIVNEGRQATATDVLGLVSRVQSRVLASRGVRLETEIVIAAER